MIITPLTVTLDRDLAKAEESQKGSEDSVAAWLEIRIFYPLFPRGKQLFLRGSSFLPVYPQRIPTEHRLVATQKLVGSICNEDCSTGLRCHGRFRRG